jgi:peroxin-14
MATVVGGVSYGLYNLGKVFQPFSEERQGMLTDMLKRYVYPLVAPPTPERLEQDKKSIDDQFEKTFALVEQVAKDTEALKAAERERTQRLDTAISELETVLSDLKMSNRRRDDDAQRIRDDVQNLKDSIPRALGNQKEVTDARLREINTELKSLKTLLAQRMNSSTGPTVVGNYLRSGAGNATPTPGSAAGGSENIEAEAATSGKAPSVADEQPPKRTEYPAATERKSPFVSGMAASGAKASIPAWQLAMAKGSGTAAATTNGAASTSEADAGGGSVQEAARSP